MIEARVFDATPCLLGEGPLWHPARSELFWFDIRGHRLYASDGIDRREWAFDRAVSAAGWLDADHLLLATERDLIRFHLKTGAGELVAPLESGNSLTRSNDGRADPHGGFWIGTMGHRAQVGAGAIYRYYRGELRQLYDRISIPNAICFTPDGGFACFADSAQQTVWRVELDARGWPRGAPSVFLDHRTAKIAPDGAIIDAGGAFLCAEWGHRRVARYGVNGDLLEAFRLPVEYPSCPALGGSTLYVTTARQGLPNAEEATQAQAGMTFAIETGLTGQPEHRVIL
ncbi:MAG: SMP-30/gluconolactonase/LRE family protein [Rhodobacteraceae bacterium]|nr:SMP-30/gluconolactonase/LRE family protein [Paracoccaceae bacterium]